VMMTIGRFGKICRNNTAKKGCADTHIPAQGSTPPSSTRRTRSCMAGIFEMSANNLPVADEDSFCGKRWEVRSGKWIRQAAPDYFFAGWFVFAKSEDVLRR
jgi:hypothetical protein